VAHGRAARRTRPGKGAGGSAWFERGSAERPIPPGARVVTLRPGVRWCVTLVARLVSEDVLAGTRSTRLILRLDRAEGGRERLMTVRAGSLEALDDDRLHTLVAREISPLRRLFSR
jgi:hypothetical protein